MHRVLFRLNNLFTYVIVIAEYVTKCPKGTTVLKLHNNTVNSEFFARFLFLQNFAFARFCENKILAKWQNDFVY